MQVGQAVIQIAASRGLKTINFVRNRSVHHSLHYPVILTLIFPHSESVDALKKQLEGLGATHVTTYDELSQKSFRDKVKEWTGGKVRPVIHLHSHIQRSRSQPLRLALNCVSGPETMSMARLLGSDAHLVSYGAMSKQPLSLPTSLFIFKNLKSVGYWQSRW
jgi:NADPH:quinone reductase-like Zn-dependent oxidoreductase